MGSFAPTRPLSKLCQLVAVWLVCTALLITAQVAPSAGSGGPADSQALEVNANGWIAQAVIPPVLEPVDIHNALDPPPEDRVDPGEYEIPSSIAELIEFLARDYKPLEAALGFEEAIAVAITHNHGLNAARLNAMSACEGVSVNWAALRPQLNLQAKSYWSDSNLTSEPVEIEIPGQDPIVFDVSNSSGPDLRSQVALGLTQRIYDFGLTNDLIDLAEAQHAIQNYTVDATEQQLVYDVIVAYYTFSVALAQVRIRMDELDLANEFLRVTEVQYDVGVVPRLDVIRAEARREQAKESLIKANASAGDAAAWFFSLLGMEDQRYIPHIVTADLLDVGTPAPSLDEAVRAALAHRPEIELQYSALFAGQAGKSLANNRPILDAYVNTLFLESPTSFQGTHSYEYGLQMVWPLYTGGKDYHERKKAEYSLLAIAEQIFDLEAKIELDVTKSWNRLMAAIATSESAKKNHELSGEAFRAASAGYSAGVTPYLEYEDALDKNVAAALAYAVSLGEIKIAQTNLIRAEGFPLGYPGDPRATTDAEVSAAALLGLDEIDGNHESPDPE